MKEQDVILNIDFVKSYMVVNNLSEKELADMIGVSHAMFNRVMNGKRGVGSKFIAGVMANVKGVTFSQFFSCVCVLPKGNKKKLTA